MLNQRLSVVKDNKNVSNEIVVIRIKKENELTAYGDFRGKKILIDKDEAKLVEDGGLYFCSTYMKGKDKYANPIKEVSINDLMNSIENSKAEVGKIVCETNPEFFKGYVDTSVQDEKIESLESDLDKKATEMVILRSENTSLTKERDRFAAKNAKFETKEQELIKRISEQNAVIKKLTEDIEKKTEECKEAKKKSKELVNEAVASKPTADPEVTTMLKKIHEQLLNNELSMATMETKMIAMEAKINKMKGEKIELSTENLELTGQIDEIDWDNRAFVYEKDLLYNPKFTSDRYRVNVTPDKSIITVSSDSEGRVVCKNNMLVVKDLASFTNIVPKKMVAINFLG